MLLAGSPLWLHCRFARGRWRETMHSWEGLSLQVRGPVRQNRPIRMLPFSALDVLF